LGPRPLVIRAQAFSGKTLVISKKDQDILTSYFVRGTSLKGALILTGSDLNEDFVSKEDTLFLNQIEEDKRILQRLSPPPAPNDASPWEY
jgi:hypothetical protein